MSVKIFVLGTLILSIASGVLGWKTVNGTGSADERSGGAIFILAAAGFLALAIFVALLKAVID